MNPIPINPGGMPRALAADSQFPLPAAATGTQPQADDWVHQLQQLLQAQGVVGEHSSDDQAAATGDLVKQVKAASQTGEKPSGVPEEMGGENPEQALRSVFEAPGMLALVQPAEGRDPADELLPVSPVTSLSVPLPIPADRVLESPSTNVSGQQAVVAAALQGPEVVEAWLREQGRILPSLSTEADQQKSLRQVAAEPLLAGRSVMTPAMPVVTSEQVLAAAVRSALTELAPVNETTSAASVASAGGAELRAATGQQAPQVVAGMQWSAELGEQLLKSLREQVELQLGRSQQQAMIRLDPPELGSLEIFISHDNGKLTIQIQAVQADVARLLGQASERLRQELLGQQFVDVQVAIGEQSTDSHRQQAQDGRPDARVLPVPAAETGTEQTGSTAGSADVLITV